MFTHSPWAQAPPPQPPTPHTPVPPPTQQPAPLSWKTDEDLDTVPHLQVSTSSDTRATVQLHLHIYTPRRLQIFLPCTNSTNTVAANNLSQGKKYKWTDLDAGDFYKYIELLLYMAMVKMYSIRRQDHIFSLPLPSQICHHRYITGQIQNNILESSS